MKLKLRVKTSDGQEFDVETNLFTVVAWERKYKRKASDMATGVGVEDLAFLAHTAAKDAGITVPLMLDDFIKKAIDIQVVEQDTENPTDPALTGTP